MILVFEAGRPQGPKRALLDLEGFQERSEQRQMGRLRTALHKVTDKWFGEAAGESKSADSKLIRW
jgi:hypothetical protein